MTMMQAVVLPTVGPPEVLRLTRLVRPKPGRGQVLVEVMATTVSPLDCQERAGQVSRFLPGGRPQVLGHDVAGVIAEVGEGVDKLVVGTSVIGLRALQTPGSYAEFVVLPVEAVTRKPNRLSFVEAAGLPLSGTVALQAIRDRGRLRAVKHSSSTGPLVELEV